MTPSLAQDVPAFDINVDLDDAVVVVVDEPLAQDVPAFDINVDPDDAMVVVDEPLEV
jgi:hypothetical protein